MCIKEGRFERKAKELMDAEKRKHVKARKRIMDIPRAVHTLQDFSTMQTYYSLFLHARKRERIFNTRQPSSIIFLEKYDNDCYSKINEQNKTKQYIYTPQ